jgi:iron complex outermembrane receptor protein
LSPSTIKQTVATINFIPATKTDSVYSAFLQDEFRIVPEKLALTVGSKLEHDTYTEFEYQPSGRLLYNPTPTRTIWGAISRAVRTPDRVDEDVQVDIFVPPVIWGRINGNHAIRSERLVAYEAGIRTLVVPRLYLGLSGFHNVYRDLLAQSAPTITPAPSPPFPPQDILLGFNYRNGVKGNTDGAEIAPELQAAEWWRIRAAYSYLHIHLGDQNGFTDKLTLTSLRGSSPNSQAFLQSQINVSRNVEFDQTVRFVGALPAQSVRSYVTGDIRLGWQPSRVWSLSVAGENLFQAHHAEFTVNPGPMVLIKRSVYAKIVWTR